MPDQPHHSASDSAHWREIVLLRRRLVSLKAQTRLLRHELARKYNPDQPRVPAGNAGGGQWTSGGGGGDPALAGADWLADLGNALSTALSFSDVVADPSGEESWAFYQDATRPDGSLAERARRQPQRLDHPLRIRCSRQVERLGRAPHRHLARGRQDHLRDRRPHPDDPGRRPGRRSRLALDLDRARA